MTRWSAIVGGVLLNLALGSLYAWSVFVLPLEQEFGWNRAQTSWVFTIAILAFAATFIFAGRLQDARGPRVCTIVGTILVSAGFWLASLTTSLIFFYLAFGVLVGVGNGFGYAAPTPVASKWFPDRRGLVVGIMVGGYGAGSAILAPVATGLIADHGWRFTFQLLSVVFLVMGLAAAFLLRNPPAGYKPPTGATVVKSVARGPDRSSAEMLRTRGFYALWGAYCLGTTAGLMTISQLVPFVRAAGFTAAIATFAVTVGAVGNTGGRVLSGWMSDTVGRMRTLKLMVAISALVTPALFIWRSNLTVLYPLVAAVYWCYGTQLSLFPSVTADRYGTKNLGMNYGLLFTAWGAAGILGPFIAGRVFNTFHDYGYAFYAAAAMAVLALVSLSLADEHVAAPTVASPGLSKPLPTS